MSDVQGGDILAPKSILPTFSILDKVLLCLKRPKLCMQIPYAGDDTQSCCILTTILNQVNRLRVPKYNFYS